jgi:predicted nucleic acid-binding protein
LRIAQPSRAESQEAADKVADSLFPITSIDTAADHFVTVRRSLETLGQVIGPCGMQIAAIALANTCALVTLNTGEFNRDPGLAVEDTKIP